VDETELVATAATAATHLGITIRAVYGLIATRYEGHLGIFATVRANDAGHGALAATIATVVAAIPTVTTPAVTTTVVTTAVAIVTCCLLGGAAVGAT